jgi:hypothetical protein
MARAGIDPAFPARVGAEDGGRQKTKGCLMKKTLLILVLLLVPTACQTETLRNPNNNKTVKCYKYIPSYRESCTQSYFDMGYVEQVDSE